MHVKKNYTEILQRLKNLRDKNIAWQPAIKHFIEKVHQKHVEDIHIRKKQSEVTCRRRWLKGRIILGRTYRRVWSRFMLRKVTIFNSTCLCIRRLGNKLRFCISHTWDIWCPQDRIIHTIFNELGGRNNDWLVMIMYKWNPCSVTIQKKKCNNIHLLMLIQR